MNLDTLNKFLAKINNRLAYVIAVGCLAMTGLAYYYSMPHIALHFGVMTALACVFGWYLSIIRRG